MVTDTGKWVFLSYRLPREPSAPRLAAWRALRRLGAALISDGLAALPHSARNLEHLEWLAAHIREAAGSAAVWIAEPTSARAHAELADGLRRAVDEEYRSVHAEAREVRHAPEPERRRVVRRLRGQLRRIGSRDYFASPAGTAARDAVDQLVMNEEVRA